jgi:chromosome segregation ATPase
MSIQTAMLIALGFLAASLLGLLLASAFWSRAVRLTTIRIKQSMPVSEAEIKADRDRLRAEYAIKVHKLETQLDQAKLERARHLIDINRRDASISALEINVGQYRSDLEENQNARRVLEQTVTDRLPRVEARLGEAKRLLFNRDREIAELMQGAKKHKLALEEASSVSAQQNAQIERLSTALTTRSGRSRGSDNQPETATGLRSEIDALRIKTREQAILIDRLQVRLGHGYLLPGAAVAKPSAAQASAQAEGDMDRLRQDLSEAEAALSAARGAGGSETEIRGLKARSEDQAGEIARLRAALSAFEQHDGKSTGSLANSKIALKAKLGSAQAQADQQATTIVRLRAELAAAHERLARQAAHFMDEMRRVGTGSVPTSGQVRRPQRSERRLAERVSQIANTQRPAPAGSTPAKATAPTEPVAAEPSKPAGNGHTSNGTPVPASKAVPEKPSSEAPAAEMPKPTKISEERRRPRLLDRITSLAKD